MHCEISLVGHQNAVISVMCAAFNSVLFMSACMTLWMHALFTYQSMFITLKVQLLRL